MSIMRLSGQLFDTANRLLNVSKRQYLDYLEKFRLDANQPGFDSLHDFVAHEIKIMTLDCAQTFLNKTKRMGQTSLWPNKLSGASSRCIIGE